MQFMTTLSSAIIALALVAQVSGALGRAFETFALVLLRSSTSWAWPP
jgi:hypothetical protein